MKKLLCLILALCFACCVLVACNTSDEERYYDDITKTLKLSKTVTDTSSFLKDGVGKATVVTHTDGDTTRFRLLADNQNVVVRYHSVNTPESTGDVEKWGKAASNFTKMRLDDADEIVLESSTGGAAITDSYGTRYLGYVWYKPKGESDFKCLNLEIVENGFSHNTGNASTDYPYNSFFDKANDFARAKKLHIYSDKDDPLYSNDPIDTTIKELNANPGNFYNEESGKGSKVRIIAYLADLKLGSGTSPTYTFIAEQYDQQTGEVHKINVYAHYSNYSQSKMKLGHLYTIIGTFQQFSGGYQLSGISYSPTGLPIENGTTVKQRNYFLTFDETKTWFSGNQYSDTLYGYLTVTSKQYANGTLTFTAKAKQCNGIDESGAKTFIDVEQTFTITVPATEAQVSIINIGAKLSLQAYKFDASSYTLTVPNFAKIIIK